MRPVTDEDSARLRELEHEMYDIMDKYHDEKSLKEGPYAVVGQMKWRIRNAVSCFIRGEMS